MLNLHVPISDIPDSSTVLKVCFSGVWLLGLACVLHFVYKYIREKTYVNVNCWFCNQNSRVRFKQKEEWTCPRCEQFNGFTRDGDYSRSIPEQHHEPFGVKRLTTNQLSPSNGLCRSCNANQELKIRQIASYVPFRESNYDQEIESFKKNLERSYKLCPVCVRTVQSTLKLKARQYCAKNISKAENYSVKASLTKEAHSNKGKRLISSLFGTITLMSLWYFVKFHESTDEHGTWAGWPIALGPLGDYYNLFQNLVVVLIAAPFVKSYSGKTTVLSSVFIGIFSFITHNTIFSTLKNCFVISVLIYFVLKYVGRKRNALNTDKKPSQERRMSDFEDEIHETLPENNQKHGTALCGEFSDMNLGRTPSVSSSSQTSYLFRRSKLLVQPPKLILDDLDDSVGTIGSYYSASSGYESVSTYHRKTPDSISEFDSVSQVGYKRLSNSTRTSPNALVQFRDRRPVYSSTHDRFYGVSSQLNLDQQTSVASTSEIQSSALFSALQIFLCSLAFFILGFSLEQFVSNLNLKFL